MREEYWLPCEGSDLGNQSRVKEHVRNSAVSYPDIKRENKLSEGSHVRRT